MYETAYFAGGCFWCITPTFRETPGVVAVTSGFSGGQEAQPSYEDVKYQRTGHRETIRVCYDPARVTYERLFEIYLAGVDPFDPEGQFIDRGHSYTLAVYCQNREQEEIALRCIRALEAEAGRQVFVAVEPFRSFYEAGQEHQDFDLKNPEAFRRELEESGRARPAAAGNS